MKKANQMRVAALVALLGTMGGFHAEAATEEQRVRIFFPHQQGDVVAAARRDRQVRWRAVEDGAKAKLAISEAQRQSGIEDANTEAFTNQRLERRTRNHAPERKIESGEQGKRWRQLRQATAKAGNRLW